MTGRYVCSVCDRGGNMDWWLAHLAARKQLAAPARPSRTSPCPQEDEE